MNDNKTPSEKRELLSEITKITNECREGYKQKRIFDRVQALQWAELCGYGRKTITQLILTLGVGEGDWSSWYRVFSEDRYAEEKHSQVIMSEALRHVEVSQPFIVGGDGFHVVRRSKTMPGTNWMRGTNTAKFKPGVERGQRYTEISWLTPVENGYSRAIPLRCMSAFAKKAVNCREEDKKSESESVLEGLHWAREEMDKNGREAQELLTLNDGNFDNISYWNGLPENTKAVVRTARNRVLYYLPKKDAHGNRKYGRRARAPHEWLKKRKLFKKKKVTIRGQERMMSYRVRGPFVREGASNHPMYLLVIGGGKRPEGSRRQRYDPCYFLISARQEGEKWVLPFPITDILTWVWQRWELEVAHRQMKSGLGLGQKQSWHKIGTIRTVQWTVWVYSLIMMAGYNLWKNGVGNDPPGRWRKRPARWSFNSVMRQIRVEMWQLSDFQASWPPSPDNWPRNPVLQTLLQNSLLASTPL